MIKLLKYSQGMTLVEGMVATGLVGIIIFGTMKGTEFLNKSSKELSLKVSTARIVLGLAQTIRGNVSLYQIDQDPYNKRGILSISNKKILFKRLPLAWNAKMITDAKKCPQCDGRLGFVITPLSSLHAGGYRGLYRLTVRVVHRTLLENYQDYHFLISGR